MANETLLLVEDDVDIRELIRYNMEREGYKVIACPSAEQAKDVLAKKVPDLILLDLMLPDSDGVSFLRMLRSNRDLMNIPVVILTSSEDSEDRLQCEKLGISSYIVKPFNEEKFLIVIRRLKSLALALEAAQCSDEPANPAD